MLQNRPFDIQVPFDSIIVYPEGPATHDVYCGTFTLPNRYGVTSGFFAYCWGPRVSAFFQKVCEAIRTRSERFYALDQPWFNLYLPTEIVHLFVRSLISVNGVGFQPEKTVFLNFAGNPGDDRFHWEKLQTWNRLLKSRKDPLRVGLFHRM